jgi:GST-like protein
MIDVYSWATPNGHKVHIMLEECGLPYRAIPVDIGAGDQFKPEFLAISPNNKIPAIVDPNGPDGEPMSVFESGAILLYLASKTGKLLPASTRAKFEVMEWLMFQMGGVGPMLGQAHHFRMYAPEKISYAIDRNAIIKSVLFSHGKPATSFVPRKPAGPGGAKGGFKSNRPRTGGYAR